LVDTFDPQADTIVLVMDHFNTRRLAALYEAFAPDEAHRLLVRLERHHTPQHGRWLNRADTELGLLATLCRDRRVSDQGLLRREGTAWE
jgi:hypothetical protein